MRRSGQFPNANLPNAMQNQGIITPNRFSCSQVYIAVPLSKLSLISVVYLL
jgi:hypothetical protein